MGLTQLVIKWVSRRLFFLETYSGVIVNLLYYLVPNVPIGLIYLIQSHNHTIHRRSSQFPFLVFHLCIPQLRRSFTRCTPTWLNWSMTLALHLPLPYPILSFIDASLLHSSQIQNQNDLITFRFYLSSILLHAQSAPPNKKFCVLDFSLERALNLKHSWILVHNRCFMTLYLNQALLLNNNRFSFSGYGHI